MFSYCQLQSLETISTHKTSILLSIPLFIKSNQGPLKKDLILGLKQEIYKIKLNHLVVPESNEVFRNKANKRYPRVCNNINK